MGLHKLFTIYLWLKNVLEFYITIDEDTTNVKHSRR